ncbi:uncharacterized protein LOC132805026 [Ziziphus jujuba]|uniref:Uncharacterized protein LOC132805026 n=1 Tax=Ziziphus jujuba TaxID=326968 RepID=A0ABM4AG99_ZIZJJ|nr:uncharacterized protein LOC132805026 [Ziziphus jujuba]
MSRQGVVPAGIVHQLLDNENYLDWSVWVKTYLMGEDLWDIVESMDEPPKPEDGDEFKNITSAKEAWDILEGKFKPQSESEDDDKVNIPNDQYQQHERFHKALQDGDRNATREFITQHPKAVRTIITLTGRTALYVAVMAGHTEIVETVLVEKMSPKDLEMKDSIGITALTAAIYYNANIKIAECMIQKNKKSPIVVDQGEVMPLVMAFRVNHIEMGRYLYSITPIEDLLASDGNRAHAVGLINQAIIGKCYDVALHLLQRCPQLATTIHTSTLRSPVHRNISKWTSIQILAKMDI